MDCLSKIRSGEHLSRSELIKMTVMLSLPAILAQLSSILMQYIDAAMVGSLGEYPSASVGLMASSCWLFSGVASMATLGFSVQIAHEIGASRFNEAKAIVRQGISAITVFGLILGAIGVAISPFLPIWLGGDAHITGAASSYFMILMAGLPILTLNFMAGGMIRCAGDMKTPSILNMMMCLMDIVFNFILIFPTRNVAIFGFDLTVPGADLGVTGAALGTVLAETVTAFLMFRYLIIKQPLLKLKGFPKTTFIPQKKVIVKALKISTPMMLEHIVFCGAQIMITIIVAPLGNIAIAANAFAVTAESICYMPGFGIGDAATAVVGQAYGAGRKILVKRLCHISVGLGVAVMTFMAVLLWACAPYMMAILTPIDAIKELGTEILRIEAFAEPMYAASIVAYGAFVGVGDTLWPSIMNFGSIWGVRVTLAFFMAPVLGLKGVWIAMAIELTFRGIIFLWRMWSGKWYNKMNDSHHLNTVQANIVAADTGILPEDDTI